jgi:hypothetical protein
VSMGESPWGYREWQSREAPTPTNAPNRGAWPSQRLLVRAAVPCAPRRRAAPAAGTAVPSQCRPHIPQMIADLLAAGTDRNGDKGFTLEFLARRGSGRSTGVGVNAVRKWARTLMAKCRP